MGLPGDLVRAAGVDVFENYVATDMRTFEGNVNPRRREEVEARYKTWLEGRGQGPQPWMPPFRVDDWKLPGLKIGYEQVARAKAGACTDFGVAAAYLLGKAAAADTRFAGVRIEVVSWSGGTGMAHTYVLVGRTPTFGDRHALPPHRKWKGQSGDAWYVVDGWAGALGYAVAYREAGGFPFSPTLDDLRLALTNTLTG